MSRLFVYDENMTDERAKITLPKLANISDIVAAEKQYIQYNTTGKLTVLPGTVIAVGEDAVFKTVETELSTANLDNASTFTLGTDYYIYICNTGNDTQDEVYLISENSTFPDGETWDDTNTRKIGGFHFGYVRNTNDYGQEINASGSVRGSGWESNVREDIVPNSVWTTKHRPKCDPTGMAYLGSGLWGDIYTASDDGANGLQSVYNKTPITGTEGLNYYIATEKAARVRKRLPSLAEFLVAAEGNPQGLDGSNTNGWTATTNTARTLAGKIKNAISNRNIMGLCDNVWKWLNEFVLDPTAGSWAWQNVMSGYGQIYMPSNTALHALIGGGNWDDGVHCGSRAVACVNSPWDVNTYVGVWCVCDSL